MPPFLAETYNAAMPGGRVTAETQPVTPENRLAWLASHDPARRPCWIAEKDGQPIGYVSLSDFHPRPAYSITAEVSLYLEPNSQGRGMGKELLAFADTQAQSLGIETLIGLIYDVNLNSLSLFDKAGYAPWGFMPRVARHAEGERGLHFLGKRIMTLTLGFHPFQKLPCL